MLFLGVFLAFCLVCWFATFCCGSEWSKQEPLQNTWYRRCPNKCGALVDFPFALLLCCGRWGSKRRPWNPTPLCWSNLPRSHDQLGFLSQGLLFNNQWFLRNSLWGSNRGVAGCNTKRFLERGSLCEELAERFQSQRYFALEHSGSKEVAAASDFIRGCVESFKMAFVGESSENVGFTRSISFHVLS